MNTLNFMTLERGIPYSCGWPNKPVVSGLRYANSLWWGGRVQSNEPMTNTLSSMWYEVGTLKLMLTPKSW